MKFTLEKSINAERHRVFDIVANFENFEKILPQYFPSIRVRSIRDETAIVEEHLRIAGRELILMTKHITKYPETHEVFVIGGDVKGSKFVETFTKLGDKTKLVVSVDIKLKGIMKIIGLFGKQRMILEFTRVIDEFAKIAEG